MVDKPGIGSEDWGEPLNAALDQLQGSADTAAAAAATAQGSATSAQTTADTAAATALAASNTADSAASTANALNTTVSGLSTTVNAPTTGLVARTTNLETTVGTPGRVLERPWEIVVASTSQADVTAAFNAALSARVGNAVQKRVIFPPGVYNLTVPFPTDTIGPAGQRENFVIEGAGRSTTTINWNNATDPLITASAVRYRWMAIKGMTIASQNAANVFAYLFSQQTGGYNQAWLFEDLHFTGAWTRGIGLDGGTAGNLNSEFTLNRVFTAPSSTWSDAFFVCGMTNNSTENQFLNYWIRDCCLSLTSGTLFRFNRGGSVRVQNGSWSAQSSANTITFFSYPSIQNNNADRNQLLIEGVRFEPKGTAHTVLDCHMGDGSVTFISCSDSGSTQNTGSYTHNRYKITAGNGLGEWAAPVVRFQDCEMGGYVLWTSLGDQQRGGFIFDGCKWYRGDSNEKADEIQGGTNPILQWASTHVPNYDFVHGFNYDDLKSWSIT